MPPLRWSLVILVPLCLVGILCAAAPPAASDGPANDKQFHDRLLKIAAIYTIYGRVDDEARWSPALCRLPNPAQAHYSKSPDETTHGQKLYSLFARDRTSYLKNKTPEIGQVIVKESWVGKTET